MPNPEFAKFSHSGDRKMTKNRAAMSPKMAPAEFTRLIHSAQEAHNALALKHLAENPVHDEAVVRQAEHLFATTQNAAVKEAGAKALGVVGSKQAILPLLKGLGHREIGVVNACMDSLKLLAKRMPLDFPNVDVVKTFHRQFPGSFHNRELHQRKFDAEFGKFTKDLRERRFQLKSVQFLK